MRLKKCFFRPQEMEYLGCTVLDRNLSVSSTTAEAVKERPVPKTQRVIRNFVKFCIFYAKFIHHFSDLSWPLTTS
jgi:hypothetical protein